MPGEIDVLETLLISIMAANLDGKDQFIELCQENFNIPIVVIILILSEVDEFLFECCCFRSFLPLF